MAEMSFAEGLALLEARSRIAVPAIWVTLAAFLATMAGELLEASGIISLNDPAADTPLSLLVAAVYMASSVIFIGSAIIMGMWIYRAHANLELAGADDLEFSPGWSVGWFFVPFMNLFKPFQAMRELWNASYGTSNAFGAQSPGTVAAWWACYVGGNVISSAAMRLARLGGDSGYAVAAFASAIGSLLIAASAWFLLTIVREILDAQRNHLQVQEAFA
ncbi:DUF4328 domain-containing protein [Altererythrobacter fulvus]|uniref:DUF4328 domain-containing protein n=1 Tax=Caenibius fulvus TaxID=2126012 RepID=UPI003015ECED